MKNFKQILTDTKELQETCLRDTTLLASVETAAGICYESINAGSKIVFAGNGGSAADSQHLATEFVSRFRFNRPPMAALALTTDTSCLTAIGNDYGFEYLFSRQIQALGKINDVFVGITTSGHSKNIINAVIEANALGMQTVLFTGSNKISSDIESLLSCAVQVPSDETARIQELHIMAGHYICGYVESRVHG